jgi:hypothetical protein
MSDNGVYVSPGPDESILGVDISIGLPAWHSDRAIGEFSHNGHATPAPGGIGSCIE